MANEVAKLNGITIANIAKFNGETDADIAKINDQEFTGTIDIATITGYTQIITAGNYGANMTYDEDNNYVYVQYPRNGGGGAAVVGSFNSSNQNVDWGSEQTIESSNAFSSRTCDYDKYNNVIWTAWIGGSGNICYARCGTINSDKSISWGARFEVQEGYNTINRYNKGILGQYMAVEQKTGARGLRNILEDFFEDFTYDIVDLKKDKVVEIYVNDLDKENVKLVKQKEVDTDD